MEGKATLLSCTPFLATIILNVSFLSIVVYYHLIALPVALTRCVHHSTCTFEHRNEIRHNDSLCEKVFVSTEKVRTLPLPFIFLLVVIDAVRLPQGDMAVEESVRNEMWLRLVHHPWCIIVIYTPPPCWCTTVAQLRSWHKHLYRHTCRVDT